MPGRALQEVQSTEGQSQNRIAIVFLFLIVLSCMSFSHLRITASSVLSPPFHSFQFIVLLLRLLLLILIVLRKIFGPAVSKVGGFSRTLWLFERDVSVVVDDVLHVRASNPQLQHVLCLIFVVSSLWGV